jgi:type III pantothenate kinase
MVLVADVGNSFVTLGLFAGSRLVRRTGVPTAGLAAAAVREACPEPWRALCVASVVPAALAPLEEAAGYAGARFTVVDGTSPLGMPVRVRSPAALGPDRLVNCVGLAQRRAPPFIVVDLGTATTLDCVDADGAFVGGAIAPGLVTAGRALWTGTARLPEVPVAAPPGAIGDDTITAMQSGIWLGHAALVDGLVARMVAELGGRPWVVATGGLAQALAPSLSRVDEVDPDLTLTGLCACHRILGGA